MQPTQHEDPCSPNNWETSSTHTSLRSLKQTSQAGSQQTVSTATPSLTYSAEPGEMVLSSHQDIRSLRADATQTTNPHHASRLFPLNRAPQNDSLLSHCFQWSGDLDVNPRVVIRQPSSSRNGLADVAASGTINDRHAGVPSICSREFRDGNITRQDNILPQEISHNLIPIHRAPATPSCMQSFDGCQGMSIFSSSIKGTDVSPRPDDRGSFDMPFVGFHPSAAQLYMAHAHSLQLRERTSTTASRSFTCQEPSPSTIPPVHVCSDHTAVINPTAIGPLHRIQDRATMSSIELYTLSGDDRINPREAALSGANELPSSVPTGLHVYNPSISGATYADSPFSSHSFSSGSGPAAGTHSLSMCGELGTTSTFSTSEQLSMDSGRTLSDSRPSSLIMPQERIPDAYYGAVDFANASPSFCGLGQIHSGAINELTERQLISTRHPVANDPMSQPVGQMSRNDSRYFANAFPPSSLPPSSLPPPTCVPPEFAHGAATVDPFGRYATEYDPMCGGGYWFDATRSSKGPQPRLRNAQMNSAPSLSMQGTVLSGARQTSVAQSMPSAIATDTDIGGQCSTSATQSVFQPNTDIDNAAESRFVRLCEGQIPYEKYWSLGDLISSSPARVYRDFSPPPNSSAKDRRADKPSCNRGDECNGLISERLTVPNEESTYPCGWNTCTSRVGNTTLRLHLKERHGLALTRSSHDPAKMHCEWTGCARLVRPENLEKHIKSVHLRSTKVRCDCCGALISRGDMMARHQRGGCTKKQTRRRKKRGDEQHH